MRTRTKKTTVSTRLSALLRTPIVGVVPAVNVDVATRSLQARLTVVIEKPITEDETPVLFTVQPQTLLLRATHPTSVEIVNQTAVPVPYVLIIVPRVALTLATAPWTLLIEALRSPIGRSALLERLTQIFLSNHQLE